MKISYDYEPLIDRVELALANGEIDASALVAVERGHALPGYNYRPVTSIHYEPDELDDEVMTVEELMDEMRDVNSII